MEKNKTQVIIPKEEAVFWMDGNGNWHNEHGRFEHPRIIKYFNRSICRDDDGFFVYQSSGDFEEKVYFRCEETAFFAVDIRFDEDWILVLNTGRSKVLDPEALLSKNDSLYMKDTTDLIKFTSKAMLKLARYIQEKDGELYLCRDDRMWLIK